MRGYLRRERRVSIVWTWLKGPERHVLVTPLNKDYYSSFENKSVWMINYIYNYITICIIRFIGVGVLQSII